MIETAGRILTPSPMANRVERVSGFAAGRRIVYGMFNFPMA